MSSVLYKGDCLTVMPTLAAASVDMVLCDLPYGTTANPWDVVIPFDALWKELVRLVKPAGVLVFTASQPFTSALVNSKLEWFKYEWIWAKSAPTGHLNAHIMPMKIHENVLVFAQEKCPYFPQGLQPFNQLKVRGRLDSRGCESFGKAGMVNMQAWTNYPHSIIPFQLHEERVHTTQKPVELLSYLIRTYTLTGETVLDMCMGSGTTGISCYYENRNFIGIEKDEKYFAIAQERIARATSELKLF